MAEYIEREVLRAKAVYMHGFGENKYVPLKAIENAPAADVEPVKHGRWIHTGVSNSTGPIIKCSACGEHINPSGTAIELGRQHLEPKRCEYCGAKMDLEVDG